MEGIKFFIPAIFGALLISVMMASIGVFIIWRRMVWVSIALSQTAGLGVAAGHVLGVNPVFTALISSYAGAIIMNISYKDKVMHKDNINAILYILSAVTTLLVFVVNPSTEWNTEQLFNGDLLYMTYRDVLITAIAFGVFITILLFSYSRWIRLVVYEQEGMEINKIHNFLFFIVMAGAIALCSHQAGLLFCFGSILFPALFVNILKIRPKYCFISAGLFSVLSVVMGIYIGFKYNLPFGLSITLFMSGGFFLAVLFKSFFKNQLS